MASEDSVEQMQQRIKDLENSLKSTEEGLIRVQAENDELKHQISVSLLLCKIL